MEYEYMNRHAVTWDTAVKMNGGGFHHPALMRNDYTVRQLENLGYKDAYRIWMTLLELAVENGIDAHNFETMIDRATLAIELRFPIEQVPRLMETIRKNSRLKYRFPIDNKNRLYDHIYILNFQDVIGASENAVCPHEPGITEVEKNGLN